jgi:hypothetical protein
MLVSARSMVEKDTIGPVASACGQTGRVE